MDIPLIWRSYFEYQRQRTYREPERWRCKRCGQLIYPNTAGANSHLAKHCREVERARAAEHKAEDESLKWAAEGEETESRGRW